MYIKNPNEFLKRISKFRKIEQVPENLRGQEVEVSKYKKNLASTNGDVRDYSAVGVVKSGPLKETIVTFNLGWLISPKY